MIRHTDDTKKTPEASNKNTQTTTTDGQAVSSNAPAASDNPAVPSKGNRKKVTPKFSSFRPKPAPTSSLLPRSDSSEEKLNLKFGLDPSGKNKGKRQDNDGFYQPIFKEKGLFSTSLSEIVEEPAQVNNLNISTPAATKTTNSDTEKDSDTGKEKESEDEETEKKGKSFGVG